MLHPVIIVILLATAPLTSIRNSPTVGAGFSVPVADPAPIYSPRDLLDLGHDGSSRAILHQGDVTTEVSRQAVGCAAHTLHWKQLRTYIGIMRIEIFYSKVKLVCGALNEEKEIFLST